MIGPNMATMLGFVLTDAAVGAGRPARTSCKAAVERASTASRVEGHTSTNDTVFLLANGDRPDAGRARPRDASGDAVTSVCVELARKIAVDAEGAEHLITIEVEGCRTDAEAKQVAKTVAESALVKTAIFGADPNWGRIVSAAGLLRRGRSRRQDLSLWMGDMLLYRGGTPLPFDAAAASAYLKHNREVHFKLRFTLGPGRCTFYTCDLTYEYVQLNADYTT